jgi:hypothetical protein
MENIPRTATGTRERPYASGLFATVDLLRGAVDVVRDGLRLHPISFSEFKIEMNGPLCWQLGRALGIRIIYK